MLKYYPLDSSTCVYSFSEKNPKSYTNEESKNGYRIFEPGSHIYTIVSYNEEIMTKIKKIFILLPFKEISDDTIIYIKDADGNYDTSDFNAYVSRLPDVCDYIIQAKDLKRAKVGDIEYLYFDVSKSFFKDKNKTDFYLDFSFSKSVKTDHSPITKQRFLPLLYEQKITGLDPTCSHEQVVFGKYLTGYVNKINGLLHLKVNVEDNSCRNCPLHFGFNYISNYSIVSTLSHDYKYGYNFEIDSNGIKTKLILKNETGFEEEFYKMTKVELEQFGIYDTGCGLMEGEYFYSYLTHRYMILNNDNLYLKTMTKMQYKFKIVEDSNELIIEKYYQEIGSNNYEYEGTNLKRVYSDKEKGELRFSVTREGNYNVHIISSKLMGKTIKAYLSTNLYPTLDKICIFNQKFDDNFNKIGGETILEEYNLTYSGLLNNKNIIEINEVIKCEKYQISYLLNKVTKIAKMSMHSANKTDVAALINYAYGTKKFTLSNHRLDSKTSYFDDNDQVLYEIDSLGNVQSNVYEEKGEKFENVFYPRLTGVNKPINLSINYIDDFSFEGNQLSSSWTRGINSQNGTITIKNGGVFGNRFLSINAGLDNAFILINNLGKVIIGKYKLTGYYRYSFGLNTHSTINVFFKKNDVMVTKNVELSSTSDNWQQFIIDDIDIDDFCDEVSISIVLEKGANLDLDDLCFTKHGRKVPYNYLKNSYFIRNDRKDIPLDWNYKNICVGTDGYSSIPSDDINLVNVIGKNGFYFEQSELEKSIYQYAYINGNKGDEILLTLFVKNNEASYQGVKAKLGFYYEDESYEVFEKIISSSNRFIPTFFSIIAKKSFYEINVEISVLNCEVQIAGVCLFKSESTTYYNYNERDGLSSIINGNAMLCHIEHDEYNRVSAFQTTQGKNYSIIRYGSQIKKLLCDNGDYLEIDYDSNNYPIAKRIVTKDGTIETKITYDEHLRMSSLFDCNGNKTYYHYDGNNNMCSAKGYMGYFDERVIGINDLLQSIKKGNYANSLSSYFGYDVYKRLNAVHLDDQLYEFIYDKDDNVGLIYQDNEIFARLEYNLIENGIQSHLPTKIIYEHAFEYDYSYDNEYNLVSISINGALKYTYDYDCNGNIIRTRNEEDKTSKYYLYDSLGLLKQTRDEVGLTISYSYDNLQNIQQVTHEGFSNNELYSYVHEYEKTPFNAEAYYNLICSNFECELLKGYKTCGVLVSGNRPNYESYYLEDDIQIKHGVMLFEYETNFVEYSLDNPQIAKNRNPKKLTSGYKYYSASCWAKVKKLNSYMTILNFKCGDGYYRILVSEEREILLNYKDKYVSSGKQIKSKWQFFTLNVRKSATNVYVSLYVDGELFASMNDTNSESITSVILGNTIQYSQGEMESARMIEGTFVTSMLMFFRNNLSLSIHKKLYELGNKAYFENSEPPRCEEMTYLASKDLSGYDVISLHGCFESQKNIKPCVVAYSQISSNRLSEFVYDEQVNDYVFESCDGANSLSEKNRTQLTYDLGLEKGNYNFFIRFKPLKTSTYATILSITYKNYQTVIWLEYNSQMKLTLHLLGAQYSCSTIMPLNEWTLLSIRVSLTRVEVYINGILEISQAVINMDLQDKLVHIGCCVEQELGADNQLNGYFDMFGYAKGDNVIKSLPTNMSYKKYVDALSRFNKVEIKEGNDVLTSRINYETTRDENGRVVEGGTTFLPCHIRRIDGSVENISFDKRGIMKIYNGKQYEYDHLNRLTKYNNNGIITTYTYDDYSNILTKSDNLLKYTFVYDSTIKTRLLKVLKEDLQTHNIEEKNISYEVCEFILNRIGDDSYNFGDGRLIAINSDIKYHYNQEGLRDKKEVKGIVTKFYYNQDKLIRERNSTYDISYIYFGDSLVGLRLNGVNYYYVRNALNEIIKIIDIKGTTYVTYEYDPWGVIVNRIISDNDIANKLNQANHILYKGYYYDEETGLFYCNSRYYSPELCRWISPDSIEYLDPESINGLNLYCYCYNNPVMYADPSGHSAILIGLIIGAIIGFGTAAYIDYIDDEQIFNGSVKWYDYLGATVLGGVIGAGLGAFAGMSFSASIPTFGWINSGGTLMFGVTGTMAVTVTGAQVLGAAGLLGGIYMFAKTSRQPGKATSSDKPSWVNESMVDPNKTAQQNAKDILDWKYGPGNWPKGPGTEYNKIVKWIERYLRYYRGW